MSEEQLETNNSVVDRLETLDPFALDEEGNLKDESFKDEYEVFKKLVICDEQGNPLSEEEQEQLKANLLEIAKTDANLITRGTATGNEEEISQAYKENLKSSIQAALVSLNFENKATHNIESDKELFAKIVAGEIPFTATSKDIVAYAGMTYENNTKLIDRLKTKFKEIPAVKKMTNKLEVFDEYMDKKYPKTWQVAKKWGKIIGRSAGNVAIYSLISATAGPIGLAGLAAKNAYSSYKNIQKQAKAEGKSFWQYAKEHKAQVGLSFATTALSLAGASIGAAGNAGIINEQLVQQISPHLRTFTRGLAVVPKAWNATVSTFKYFAKGKNRTHEDWEKVKADWSRLAEVSVGMFVGSQVAQEVADHVNVADDNNQLHTEPNNTPMTDADHDGISDFIDRDGGEGWANANETQLNRAFDADPRSINAIINDGQWHSSAELREMFENGSLTEEQKIAIYNHAAATFDEEGHIKDPELRHYYEEKAQQAKAEEMSDVEKPATTGGKTADVADDDVTEDAEEKPEQTEETTKTLNEKHYQQMTAALQGDEKDATSLKEDMRSALKDEGKTVNESISEHFEQKVENGILTEEQATQMENLVNHVLEEKAEGKQSDQNMVVDDKDVSKSDINKALKETEQIMTSMEVNADKIAAADKLEEHEVSEGQIHAETFSRDTQNARFYKGMATVTDEIQHTNKPIGEAYAEALSSGELSEKQAFVMNTRYTELIGEGKTPEQAIQTMEHDFENQRKFYEVQEKAEAIEEKETENALSRNRELIEKAEGLKDMRSISIGYSEQETYSSDTKSPDFYKGMRDYVEKIQSGEAELMTATCEGHLSNGQAMMIHERYQALAAEGKTGDQALSEMKKDFENLSKHYQAQENAERIARLRGYTSPHADQPQQSEAEQQQGNGGNGENSSQVNVTGTGKKTITSEEAKELWKLIGRPR